jgi:hypothetical protein
MAWNIEKPNTVSCVKMILLCFSRLFLNFFPVCHRFAIILSQFYFNRKMMARKMKKDDEEALSIFIHCTTEKTFSCSLSLCSAFDIFS